MARPKVSSPVSSQKLLHHKLNERSYASDEFFNQMKEADNIEKEGEKSLAAPNSTVQQLRLPKPTPTPTPTPNPNPAPNIEYTPNGTKRTIQTKPDSAKSELTENDQPSAQKTIDERPDSSNVSDPLRSEVATLKPGLVSNLTVAPFYEGVLLTWDMAPDNGSPITEYLIEYKAVIDKEDEAKIIDAVSTDDKTSTSAAAAAQRKKNKLLSLDDSGSDSEDSDDTTKKHNLTDR